MARRYGTGSRKRLEFRIDPRVETRVNVLMRYYGFHSYSTLLRFAISEAYNRLPKEARTAPK